ncbi:hypothetical protein DERP_008531 [Dermatophagoides pteronyssinus]|uniref:Uncharacterized protein n=1 Tax=Dermatophagoides pteronyssinus TaxID=6956 RepID=A0ABQ8IWI4_DERPT|nr:hypothetical protein DERP_008531 [Dermatophagoides pteronyssinus]
MNKMLLTRFNCYQAICNFIAEFFFLFFINIDFICSFEKNCLNIETNKGNRMKSFQMNFPICA